jgi:hypothetical protein
MNTVIKASQQNGSFQVELPAFLAVEVTATHIIAHLTDERIVSVPLWWSWRLAQASPAERSHIQIIGAGHTAWWPDVDEHLSVQGFLSGTPAPRPQSQVALFA